MVEFTGLDKGLGRDRAPQEVNFDGTAVIELAHEADFQPTRPLRESWRISREFVRTELGF